MTTIDEAIAQIADLKQQLKNRENAFQQMMIVIDDTIQKIEYVGSERLNLVGLRQARKEAMDCGYSHDGEQLNKPESCEAEK